MALSKSIMPKSIMSKSKTNFSHALAAVLLGNLAYFSLIRHLPPQARHLPFHIDLGLAVDFWFCLVVFGVIKAVVSPRRKSNKP
jgi:hypothetical protein